MDSATGNPPQLRQAVIGVLRFLTSERRNEIISLASESGDYLTDEVARNVLLKMNSDVSNMNPLGGALVVLFLVLVGSYYIYSNVIA